MNYDKYKMKTRDEKLKELQVGGRAPRQAKASMPKTVGLGGLLKKGISEGFSRLTAPPVPHTLSPQEAEEKLLFERAHRIERRRQIRKQARAVAKAEMLPKRKAKGVENLLLSDSDSQFEEFAKLI